MLFNPPVAGKIICGHANAEPVVFMYPDGKVYPEVLLGITGDTIN
jgi:hypothetical protein